MNIPSWCRRGASVLCVQGTWSGLLPDEQPPVLMATYTIRHVLVERSRVWVRLKELRNPRHWYGRILPEECTFAIEGFRPLVDTTTDDEVEQRLFRKKRLHQPVSARLTA